MQNSDKDALWEEHLDKQHIIGFYDSFYKKKGVDAIRNYRDYEGKFSYLARYAQFKPRERLLDVGCGTGQFLKVAEKFGLETYGLEISSEAIKLAQENVPNTKLSIGEGEHLPFENKFFDYITCLGSLEHFADLHGAVNEMTRVAKNDATFLIMVPNRDYFLWKLTGSLGTAQRKYREVLLNLDHWKEFLKEHGLGIVRIYHDNWPRTSVHIFKHKNPWRILRRAAYQLLWLFVPLRYTYQFIFILRKR